MELVVEHAREYWVDNLATREQLKGWIADNEKIIQAFYTLMSTNCSWCDWVEEKWYHTWADFSPYGGNKGAIINVRIVEGRILELMVEDEDEDDDGEVERRELVEVKE